MTRGGHRRIDLDQMEGACHYCGVSMECEEITRDHIVPRKMGGSSSPWNIVSACRKCNGRKRSQWPTCKCPTCQDAVNRYLLDGLVFEPVQYTTGWLVPPSIMNRARYA